MCKLISTCCVCGKIMGVTTCVVNGVAAQEERVSHGYCSDDCKRFVPVQLMFWDAILGAVNMDQGQQVGAKFYWKGKEITRYIMRAGDMALAINISDTAYNEEVVVSTTNQAHMHRVLKDEAKKWDIPVILA